MYPLLYILRLPIFREASVCLLRYRNFYSFLQFTALDSELCGLTGLRDLLCIDDAVLNRDTA